MTRELLEYVESAVAPQPAVPQPAVPQPAMPQPATPQTGAPQPATPPTRRSVAVAPVPSRQQLFAASVTAVLQSARDIAAAHARHAVLVEQARLAGTLMHSRDCFTGGPQWSSDMVVDRQIVTELAVALHLSEADTRRLVITSEGLVGPFAATLTELEAGRISYRHAEKIVQHSQSLPEDRLPLYEAALLPEARRVTPQRLERLARAAVEVVQPTTAVQRHLDAAAGRRLYLDPGSDGMAYLTALLPAVEAVAVFNRATDLARSAKNAGDPRTMTQLRVDCLTDLMLNAETSIPGVSKGIRARVNVTVPVLTLLPSPAGVDLGCDAGPAMLDGYGPIDRLTALELTRNAPGFQRVLTDPATGCVLTYGRQRYKPPADLDELVRLAHAECTFPLSCESSAVADLDHTIAWSDGGETGFGNLSPLCSSHHKVKHHTEWMIEQQPDGTITWTSPAGFVYIVEPTPSHKPVPRFTAEEEVGESIPF